MAPLPKRKHSTQRKGKRVASRRVALSSVVTCPHCNSPKLSHRTCKKCGK